MHYIHGWCRIVVAVNSPMRVDARSCMNVFGTSDSKYYRRQSLWDERRRVLHCPINWWAFLFMYFIIIYLRNHAMTSMAHCHVVMLPLTDISIKLLERLKLNSNCRIRHERTPCMCVWSTYFCLLSAITFMLLKISGKG